MGLNNLQTGGTGGISPGGLRNLTEISTIPDSVVYQYPVSSFGTSTWTDQVGSADINVNGLVSSTFSNGEASVFGDGSDDYGLASGPESIPQNETFGIAFTISVPSGQGGERVMGGIDGDVIDNFQISFGSDGSFILVLNSDGGDEIGVESGSGYDDGNSHSVILNKTGNQASEIEWYIDDMSADLSNVTTSGTFDPSTFDLPVDLAFFARNFNGTIENYLECDVGIFEFNSEPYSQSDRDGFVSRRPEV